MRARHRHFNPAHAGASLALDARFITGASNESTVQTWVSRTGSNNAIQNNASNRATYNTAIQGGNPALRFDGNDEYLFAANIISGTPDGTAVWTYKVDTDPPSTFFEGPVLGDFGSDGRANHWPWRDGVIYDDFGTTDRKTAGNPNQSLDVFRIISQHSAANDWVIFIDGTVFYSTSTNTVGWSSTQRIGCAVASSGNIKVHLVGHIGSISFFQSKLSDSSRKRVEQAKAFSWKIRYN